jgi:hypothetical protein
MAKPWDDPKDPEEVLDYVIDWTLPLAGDTIVSSVWTLPEDTDLIGGEETFTPTTVTIWLSGGTAGKDYALINTITTAAGRTREQTGKLRCRTK